MEKKREGRRQRGRGGWVVVRADGYYVGRSASACSIASVACSRPVHAASEIKRSVPIVVHYLSVSFYLLELDPGQTM
jgi:hypothetical protein